MHSSAVFLIEFGAIILGLGLLGRLAGRLQFSPIPLYLLAGPPQAGGRPEAGGRPG